MTPQEYEQKKRECWEEFIGTDGFPTETMRQCFNFAFDRAYKLGKQERDAGTVIQGWVARDKDGRIFAYTNKPVRDYSLQEWESDFVSEINGKSFPDLTWDDEPIKVSISIKRE